jgi:hypothetical protein
MGTSTATPGEAAAYVDDGNRRMERVPTTSVEKETMAESERPTTATDFRRPRLGRTWDAAVGEDDVGREDDGGGARRIRDESD